MLTRTTALLILALLLGWAGAPQVNASTLEDCTKPSRPESLTNDCRWQIIETIWKNQRPWLEEYLRTKLEANDGVGMYQTQLLTNGLFVAAVKQGRIDLVNSLADLYLIPAGYLREVTTYRYYYVPGHPRVSEHPLSKSTRLWLRPDINESSESILNSSQFLFLIANAIALTGDQRLIDTYWDVLVGHYERWCFDSPLGPFQRRGWGGTSGVYNHSDFIDILTVEGFGQPNSYANAVTDTDMWIITGTIELLAADREIDTSLRARFIDYARRGVALIESRTTTTNLTNWKGRAAQGADFDYAVYRDHPTYAYAGYTGDTFPIEAAKAKADVGSDFSHATRYVEVFESLYRRRELLGTEFPYRGIMEGLANQLAYKIFNGDFDKPLFANFFDGTNGWFRINYSDRKGFGYAPYDLSASMIYGSYGRWSEFNDDIAIIMRALWEMILSERPDVIEHRRNHFERRHYSNFERHPGDDIFSLETSLRILPFLSSFPSLE